MFSRKITTLNIEANSIRGLVLNGNKIEWWDSLELQPGVVRDGLVLDPKSLGQAISTLFSGIDVRRDRMIVSLTGLHSTFRILTVPRLNPAQTAEAVRRAAKREMPLPVDELYLTWQLLGLRNNKQEVFVLGVPREAVDALAQSLISGGFRPYIMDLKSLALARVARRSEALLLDLEPENFGITLIAEGVPAIMRTFIPKRGDMLLEDNVRRLAGEILRTVEFYNRDHSQKPLGTDTPVFLTGEMAVDPETFQVVQGEIEYPIAPISVPLVYDTAFPIASYAVNIGLALRGKV